MKKRKPVSEAPAAEPAPAPPAQSDDVEIHLKISLTGRHNLFRAGFLAPEHAHDPKAIALACLAAMTRGMGLEASGERSPSPPGTPIFQIAAGRPATGMGGYVDFRR